MDDIFSYAFHWLLALIPALIYVAVGLGNNHILRIKREGLERLMEGDAFGKYIRAYFPRNKSDKQAPNPRKVIGALFEPRYGKRTYMAPMGILVATSFVAGIAVVLWVKLPLGILAPTGDFLAGTPQEAGAAPAVFAALAGAYVWGLYDVLRRYQILDLTPGSLHFIWLRLIVAPVLGGLAGAVAADPFALLGAFGLGAFPLRTLKSFVKEKAASRLNITQGDIPTEPETLHYLQGLTKEVTERLEEDFYTSAEHVANADPVKLYLQSGFEWKVVLDLIDQAILFMYVGDKLPALRPIGIRGAIELVELYEDNNRSESEDLPYPRERAEKMVKSIAEKLEEEEHTVENMIWMLKHDPQVDLIMTLWGETGTGPNAGTEPENTSEAQKADT
jgi:hypothetical protein